jgi:uncharacterized protein (TIGR03435 family)
MDAKASRQSTIEELHAMLQNLLMERFNLETKTLADNALVIDNGGPKIAIQDAKAGETHGLKHLATNARANRRESAGTPLRVR